MTLKGTDYFDKQYYVYNRRLLSIVGLWPYQEQSKHWRHASFIGMLMAMGFISQICLLLQSELKMEAITQLLQTLLPTFCFTSLYCNLQYNLLMMKTIFNRIVSDCDQLTDEEELIVMHKYAFQSRIWTLMIACTFYLYIARLLFPSVLNLLLYGFGLIDYQQLILPLHIENCLANKMRYITLLMIEVVITITICTVGVAYYSMFILFIHHACALFTIATIKIDKPFKNNECTFFWTSSTTKRNEEHEWIVTVIKFYNDIIRFVELIQLLCGRTYFIEALLALIFIILDFVYLLSFTLNINEAVQTSLYVIANVLNIYGYLYFGQMLINHSVDLHSKCCQIPFYLLSVKTNKLLLLLITRTMKQCCLSVQGTLIASHEFLASITRTSFSFAMVYYNMR